MNDSDYEDEPVPIGSRMIFVRGPKEYRGLAFYLLWVRDGRAIFECEEDGQCRTMGLRALNELCERL